MRIPSLAFACKKLGYNIKTVLPNVSKMPKHLQKHTLARATLEIIHEASWDGVEIDYDNPDQKKWGFWVWLNKPGFRLCDVGYGIDCSGSDGGPRLCCLSEGDMRYHFKKHFALYKDAIVIPKVVKKKK
jgi:hypothetical protein